MSEIQTTAEAEEQAVLPRMHVGHADLESEDIPLPKGVARKPISQKSPAEWAYERLVLYIQKFEETLDQGQEVAMGFTGSDTGVIRIEAIGFFDPDIVTFYGSDEQGLKTQLVQHVTQLNVMLRAMPKPASETAPRRIGFRLAADIEKG